MIKKEEAKLIFIGIVISAYMTISYDMIRELIENPSTNTLPIAIAGLASLGVGGVLFLIFIKGKVTK